ncbi:RISC-loading complex subunit tarbp2-like, partial [Vespula maculifrons]
KMGKTAIMILQELGMKEGFLPVYTLLRSQTGKQINIFTFKVQYKDFSAIGQALNKKDAKQKAAQNMLTLLEDPNNISKTKPLSSSNDIYPDASPSTSGQALLDSTLMYEDLRNYVGSLQQYCLQNKLMQAEYQTTNITGPAHEKVFTMSCTVGSITEEATGTRKKQVKQRVAEKVLERLTNTNDPSVANKDECGSSNPFKDCDNLSGIDKDVLNVLSLKVDNCKLNETESQANQKKKFLDPNIKSYLGPALPKDVTELQNRHLLFKQYVYNTVCNGSEEKLIEIFNTVKGFKRSFMDIEKYDIVRVTSLEQEILIYIEEKMKLSMEKKIIHSRNPLLKITAFKISTPVAIFQFGAHNSSLVAGAIALVNILDTIIIYLE